MSRRVLVVDDNSDAADSLALLLALWGYQVEVARSGPDALIALGAFIPDAVLMDIGLPGLSGYEVARRVRAAEANGRRTLLVAITGYGQDEDVRQARAAGFDHHLLKPADPLLVAALLAPPAGPA